MLTNPDDFAQRVDALEAQDAIRRLMAAYVQARDLGEDAAGIEVQADDAVGRWTYLQLAVVQGRAYWPPWTRA